MTLNQFIDYIEKEYCFDKYFDYIYVIFFSYLGITFIYKTIFTDWSAGSSVGLLLFTLGLGVITLYWGVIGIFFITKVTEIYQLSSNGLSVDQNKRVVEKACETINLKEVPQENKKLLKFHTKTFIFLPREILVFVDTDGIYINIQQENFKKRYQDYIGYRGNKKLLQKLKTEILQQQNNALGKENIQ